MKILGTGLTGLVGSRIVELLSNQYQFENLSRETGFDITDKEKLEEKVKNSDASIILHLSAKTNVDECEKDKETDLKILGYNDKNKQEEEFKRVQSAWAVNVLGTQNIVGAVLKSSKKLIYISTDFVFDGEKTDGYLEGDIPNPVNWYAKTKYEAEKVVQSQDFSWLIVRIAYPYRANFLKKDFVRVIIDRLKSGNKLTMITNHVMSPTYIDDTARAIDLLIQENVNGIFHVVGSQFITPYDAALQIAESFGFDRSLISKITREEYFKNRAQRPFYLGLKNDKIKKLGVKMSMFQEGIEEIKKQMG